MMSENLKSITIGIDAHNIRGNGGSLIHLKELLAHTNPNEQYLGKLSTRIFEKIIVWVNKETREKLPNKSHITYIVLPQMSVISLLLWQKNKIEIEAKQHNCNVLFFPGGIYLGNFKPFVAFSQSMLPFDHKIRKIYWKTSLYPKLIFKEFLMKNTFNKADGIIFVSNAMREQVEKVMQKSFSNSTVIHHGVSNIFKPKENRKKVFKKGDKIKFLTVSSHALHKNLVNLVNAVSELKKENYNVELKIVGPYTKYGSKQLLKAVNRNDPKEEFIKIVGDVEYEELPKFYEEADILVFPSLCESFGMPLIEACAVNLPIIISESAFKRDIRIENVFIVRTIDKSNLAVEINKTIGKEQESLVQNNYCWNSNFEQTFGFLKKSI